jgi:tRNA pseudouridine55 synthase
VELEHDTLEITVTCSKGTYIRSLAEDLGRFLGCGAHLSSLRRTRTGPFHVDQSRRPEHLMAMTQQQRLDCILPVSNLLADLPDLVLNQNQIRNLYYGQCVDLGAESAPGLRRLYDSHYVFVGLGELDSNHNLSPKRLMAAD